MDNMLSTYSLVPAMSKVQLEPDTESFAILSARCFLSPIIEASVLSRLTPHLVYPPGSREPLVSKAKFVEALEDFCNCLPEARNAIEQRKAIAAATAKTQRMLRK